MAGAAPMPPPIMRKHGGKIPHHGAFEPSETDISTYHEARPRKDGGRLPKGGAFSGVGRLGQAEKMKGRREG
jgi:hypothetical protein